MKQIDHNIETQYNVVRDQMKNINTKRDVLKRMRDNIKKLANNMIPKQRIDIETDFFGISIGLVDFGDGVSLVKKPVFQPKYEI